MKNHFYKNYHKKNYLFLLFATIFFNSLCFAESSNQIKYAAVASADSLATDAGLSILRQGGNAFDAGIAVAATLAVTEPYGSGLGGGGFWLIHDSSTGKDFTIDARECAPKKATFSEKNDPQPAKQVGRYIGIPGTPKAIDYIATHLAKLSLRESLSTAIDIAESGYNINADYIEALQQSRAAAKYTPEFTAIFKSDKQKLSPRIKIYQPQLATRLKALASEGSSSFYTGKFAKQLVKQVNAIGGQWHLDDLKNYKIKIRKPLKANIMGQEVITMGPPSAGGSMLITMLNSVEQIPNFQKLDPVIQDEYLIRIMKRVYCDRSVQYGDPDFVDIPLEKLTSKVYAKQIVTKLLQPEKKQQPTKSVPLQEHHTTHFSIIDSMGNRVAATLSLNNWFGSGVVVDGVLLNDELRDFSNEHESTWFNHLKTGEKNAIAAYKRPLSSMTPTFITDKCNVRIIGTPGGGRITSMLMLSSLDAIKGNSLWHMLSLPRIHHQNVPDKVQYETGSLSQQQVQILQKKGYSMQEKSSWGNMQGVAYNSCTHQYQAVSDPRHLGKAQVIRVP